VRDLVGHVATRASRLSSSPPSVHLHCLSLCQQPCLPRLYGTYFRSQNLSKANSNSKPIKTYSRKRSLPDDEPSTKRRRVEHAIETTGEEDVDLVRGEASTSLPLARDVAAIPTSSPKSSPPIFSDDAPRSTPPSSPLLQASSTPPVQIRRLKFSFLKKRPEPEITSKEALGERSNNVQSPSQQPLKKKRLVQMQLDLVSEIRKACKVCGMEYIPSNPEDAVLHKKFHATSVGGIVFTKAFVERLKQNEVWTGGDGSFIAVIRRTDALALRNKAVEVLRVVNTELAAVTIPEQELWSQIHVSIPTDEMAADGANVQPTACGKQSGRASDCFKVYLYISGSKCVGACLAKRIEEAFPVVDEDGASERTGQVPADHPSSSSSISVGTVPEPALLGISRVWTSNLHRKQGIATRLLGAASSDFLYGMTITKESTAFSQPTESGGKLARKWFGRRTGWHVYID
jgi:hypothetical protein